MGAERALTRAGHALAWGAAGALWLAVFAYHLSRGAHVCRFRLTGRGRSR